MNKKMSLSAGIAVIAAAMIAIAAFAVQTDGKNDSAYGFESSGSMAEDLVTADASEMVNGFLNAYDGEYVTNLLNPIDGQPLPDFSVVKISDREARASTVSPMPGFLDALYCGYTVCDNHDEAMELFGIFEEFCNGKTETVVMDAIYYHAIDAKGSFPCACGLYGDSPAGSFMKGPWVLVYYCAVYKNVFVESTFFVDGTNYEYTDFNAVIDAMFKGVTDPVPVAAENEAIGICCFTNITADDETSAAYSMAQYFKNHYNGKCIDKDFTVKKVDENTSQIYKKGPNSHAPHLYCKFTVCKSNSEAKDLFDAQKNKYEGHSDDSFIWAYHSFAINKKGSFQDGYGYCTEGDGFMGDWVLVYYTAIFENVYVDSAFYVEDKEYSDLKFNEVISAAYDSIYYTLYPQE